VCARSSLDDDGGVHCAAEGDVHVVAGLAERGRLFRGDAQFNVPRASWLRGCFFGIYGETD
jgi:hypothetical protein